MAQSVDQESRDEHEFCQGAALERSRRPRGSSPGAAARRPVAAGSGRRSSTGRSTSTPTTSAADDPAAGGAAGDDPVDDLRDRSRSEARRPAARSSRTITQAAAASRARDGEGCDSSWVRDRRGDPRLHASASWPSWSSRKRAGRVRVVPDRSRAQRRCATSGGEGDIVRRGISGVHPHLHLRDGHDHSEDRNRRRPRASPVRGLDVAGAVVRRPASSSSPIPRRGSSTRSKRSAARRPTPTSIASTSPHRWSTAPGSTWPSTAKPTLAC